MCVMALQNAKTIYAQQLNAIKSFSIMVIDYYFVCIYW